MHVACQLDLQRGGGRAERLAVDELRLRRIRALDEGVEASQVDVRMVLFLLCATISELLRHGGRETQLFLEHRLEDPAAGMPGRLVWWVRVFEGAKRRGEGQSR